MYEIIKKGSEDDFFSIDVQSLFYSTISNEILKVLKENKKPKPAILGAFAMHNVPLKNGDKKNVWIEYNAKILPIGLVDAGIHAIILYDDIPDIILDKYNDIKTLIIDLEDEKKEPKQGT